MAQFSVRTWMTSVPPTIGPKESLRRARAVIHASKTSELLVLDNGKLVGMLNERDIWQHCPSRSLLMDEHRINDLLDQFRVGAVMALHPPVIAPDMPLADAAQLFAQSGRTGLPVVEEGALVGFLSETSFMQAVGVLLSTDGEKVSKSEE